MPRQGAASTETTVPSQNTTSGTETTVVSAFGSDTRRTPRRQTAKLKKPVQRPNRTRLPRLHHPK
ncbi:hypothetical protein PIB30_061618 [Stylosanthes scabra]|uniref:Uncharacterized protein n=1 Tax=Stylosanthes scabra TaxID=79078 RepID=A0ABU6ZJN7_9FABA|nr:hypothetical protein [Stylosanthes scabra]